jgi:transposase
VQEWRERYAAEGIAGILHDRPRGLPFAALAKNKEAAMVEKTLHEKPKAATHWSCRSMAEASGLSKNSVQRIWNAHGLKPHLVKTFKLSNDPQFVEKLRDVVGLYMNPPENALILSIDEKSQIQALDRTQPGLPMKKGRADTMTHDYKRHGTTTLFAALDVLKGEVIGQCLPRHRHQEFLKFLKLVDKKTPAHLELHCIVDNYATHKKQEVKDWLAKHPRFHFHFIPTSSSWLNLVERWFRDITEDRIRRDAFSSVTQLQTAIYDYIDHNNNNPKPFVWTQSADHIIAKVNRGKALLGTLH